MNLIRKYYLFLESASNHITYRRSSDSFNFYYKFKINKDDFEDILIDITDKFNIDVIWDNENIHLIIESRPGYISFNSKDFHQYYHSISKNRLELLGLKISMGQLISEADNHYSKNGGTPLMEIVLTKINK